MRESQRTLVGASKQAISIGGLRIFLTGISIPIVAALAQLCHKAMSKAAQLLFLHLYEEDIGGVR